MSLESFRFDDNNEYRYDITFKVFARVVKKRDSPESFMKFFLFLSQKISTVIYIEGVKPSLDSKMIKFLTFDKIFPPLRHSRVNS